MTGPTPNPLERQPVVQLRDWDTRVVWLEAKQRWWWNAWRARTATELHGFADSQAEAMQAMQRAIAAVPAALPPAPGEVPRGGWQR